MNPIELFSGRDRNFNTVTICDIIELAEQLSSTTHQPARQVISIQTRTGENRRESFISENAIIERLISAAQLLAPMMRCMEGKAAGLSTVPAMFVIKAIAIIDPTDSSAPSVLQTASTVAIPTPDRLQPSNLLEATSVSLNPMPPWAPQSSASHSNAEAPTLDDVVYAHRDTSITSTLTGSQIALFRRRVVPWRVVLREEMRYTEGGNMFSNPA
jgi:hypothetical protein